jgi:small-conductance mechanosensitive channel
MAKQERELLRPEDASSLEEFEARCAIDQARSRAVNSSWAAIGQTVLAALIFFVDIFFWFAMVKQQGAGRWVWLVFALLFAYLFLRMFGRVLGRGTRGSKRYMELSRLRKEWQAKAERGEIPQTTPGGVKVWRDELESEPRSS